MWATMMKLASAVHHGTVQYAVLVVCPNSSGTIKDDLARDLERLSGGRTDGLKTITHTFLEQLKDADLSVDKVAGRLRIVVLNCVVANGDSIRAAKALLRNICCTPADADGAWSAIYVDATRLIDIRGARAADSIARLLQSEGISLKDQAQAPSALWTRFCVWRASASGFFSIPGIAARLSVVDAWIELDVVVCAEDQKAPSGFDEALKQYHLLAQRDRRRSDDCIKGTTLARFIRHSVLIGGPGMGKSTLLKKLAHMYASDGVPVIHFAASIVAQRMRVTGCGFEEGIVALGTDGSGLPISAQSLRSSSQLVLLCDALDESANDQENVCEGLVKFAAGFPHSRIVVTTRPIGYQSGLLRSWRHYELQALESGSVVSHIERLLSVAISDSASQDDALRFAREQINQNKSVEIAARSPLILGLVAALVIQRIPLGDSKTQLYERLFNQMMTASSGAIPDVNIAPSILSAFLDMFAWELHHTPATRASDLLAKCSNRMAIALSETVLKARSLCEQCFTHWERVGMVEKLNDSGIDAATFIHKTFGEYAAARYLTAISPEQVRCEIDTKLDLKAWGEILRFASSLGLADVVYESRIGTSSDLTYAKVIEALSMISNGEVAPSAHLRKRALDAAALHLRSPISREVISIGNSLVEVGEKFPQEVAAIATQFDGGEQPWTRLAVYTAMTFSPQPLSDGDLEALILELPSLIDVVYRKSSWNGLFDLHGRPAKQIDALCIFAVSEALQRFTADEAGRLITPLFSGNYRGTTTGQESLIAALLNGQRLDLAEPLRRQVKEQWAETEALFANLDLNTVDDAKMMIRALQTQLPQAISPTTLEEDTIFWQISGFFTAMGFSKRFVNDEWPAHVDASDAGIQETLRGCLLASGVDISELSREVATAVASYLGDDNNKFSRHMYRHTREVDIAMNWDSAKNMNLAMLERALHFETTWFVEPAANLIAVNANSDELTQIVQNVFATGEGLALWAASQLCLTLPEPMKSQLLLERLERPLVPGCQYLYDALTQLPLLFNQRLFQIASFGLTSSGPLTAIAATTVVEKFVVESSDAARLLQESFDLWCSKEAPPPEHGGAVPHSPRENILEALLKNPQFEKLRLLRYSADVRRDVAQTASEALVDAICSGSLRDECLTAIGAGEVPPNILIQALKRKAPFTAPHVDKIRSFLSEQLEGLQRIDLLTYLRGYLSDEEYREHMATFLNDKDTETQERARRMLSGDG